MFFQKSYCNNRRIIREGTTKELDRGYFVISLDFELIYGMLDVLSEEDNYYTNLIGTRNAILGILDLFKEYSVAATWAAVGMLFHSNESELKASIPSRIPKYTDQNLSVYKHISDNVERESELFFASDLIALIAKYPKQEIATHTYSHYYCTEPGQTIEEFDADIQQAVKVMKEKGYDSPYSIVFPRNMWNDKYLSVIEKHGIRAYRGESKVWYDKMKEGYLKKAIRMTDAYINIGGNECCELTRGRIVNIPASRFLYHYGKIPHCDWLKIHRIKNQMKYAAIHKKVFHLWWHPHNFGTNTENNLRSLRSILNYYSQLQVEYNMASANMKTLGEIHCIKE